VGGTLSGGPIGGVEGIGSGAARGAATGSQALRGDVDTTAGTTIIQPNPQQQAMLAELSQTPAGPRFDRLYGRMQVQSHEMTIGMFRSYAASGPNPALRAHAEQALPVLQSHYQMAQSLPGTR
jgi:predicted outer membrane protein